MARPSSPRVSLAEGRDRPCLQTVEGALLRDALWAPHGAGPRVREPDYKFKHVQTGPPPPPPFCSCLPSQDAASAHGGQGSSSPAGDRGGAWRAGALSPSRRRFEAAHMFLEPVLWLPLPVPAHTLDLCGSCGSTASSRRGPGTTAFTPIFQSCFQIGD